LLQRADGYLYRLCAPIRSDPRKTKPKQASGYRTQRE
jgi:hypothetical protein